VENVTLLAHKTPSSKFVMHSLWWPVTRHHVGPSQSYLFAVAI